MIRTIVLALVLAAGLGLPAAAQTVGYADAIAILARSCGADIGRFCQRANLANNGITRCLGEHAQQISPQCAGDLAAVRASLQARAAAQAAAFQVCQGDARRLCPMTQPGRGHILRCLLTAEPRVGARCNAAITNAGWR